MTMIEDERVARCGVLAAVDRRDRSDRAARGGAVREQGDREVPDSVRADRHLEHARQRARSDRAAQGGRAQAARHLLHARRGRRVAHSPRPRRPHAATSRTPRRGPRFSRIS